MTTPSLIDLIHHQQPSFWNTLPSTIPSVLVAILIIGIPLFLLRHRMRVRRVQQAETEQDKRPRSSE
ncbi:hypothetical protein [Ktedonospora formicarum]|uniref:Uncharacterized protein n=1 Tax=Ktedonospora formicarum TaxID=2778364 RepID=A0A8J3IC44_9CHLR|nr:hypothetical protein [Ktedonospora formicarum]GHO48669.1 hypothetical protein KSX_68320 [Ktedonospora formicarum]